MKKIIILIALCLGVNVFSISTQDGLYCSVISLWNFEEKKINDLTKKDYKEAKRCGIEFLIADVILREKKISELNDKEFKYILKYADSSLFVNRLKEEKDTLLEERKRLIRKYTARFLFKAWGLEDF